MFKIILKMPYFYDVIKYFNAVLNCEFDEYICSGNDGLAIKF